MTATLILVSIDSLRADHCSMLGYERGTTPRLAEAASDGLVAERCYAQSSHTRESMPSMLYGVYPTRLDAVGHVPSDCLSLAEILADEGWATAGFHSNPYLSRAYGFDEGFDTFEDGLPLATNRIVTFFHRVRNHFSDEPYTRAEQLNKRALDWLSNHKNRSTFVWLHYMDPHGPYQPPAAYQRLFRDEVVKTRRAKKLWRRSVDNPKSLSDREVATLIDLYDAEIKYTDAMIGELLNGLDALNDASDTVVAIGSDHGDLFGEHDEYGHPRRVYDELVHVPLAILGDGITSKRIQRPVENVDIMPTLFASANIGIETADIPVNSSDDTSYIGIDGTSLYEKGDNEFAFSFATGEDDESDHIYAALRDRTRTAMGIWTTDGTRIEKTVEPAKNNKNKKVEINYLLVRLEQILENTSIMTTNKQNSSDRQMESDRNDVSGVVADRLEELGYR